MKPFVKDAVGHFRSLILHSLKEYEPSPTHVLNRLLKPLCKDFKKILEKGTTKDTAKVIEQFFKLCQKYLK